MALGDPTQKIGEGRQWMVPQVNFVVLARKTNMITVFDPCFCFCGFRTQSASP